MSRKTMCDKKSLTELLRLALNELPTCEELSKQGYVDVEYILCENAKREYVMSDSRVRMRLVKLAREGKVDRVRAKRRDGAVVWMYKLRKKK